ncbi:MAG: HlyD family secretion protein [Bacteroidetes bacterium]|nr:HlyD family secretion protein [Bacteroidota bacterium]
MIPKDRNLHQEYEKIELRSNEVQEILNRPPKWIIRWGITIIFFVIVVVLVGSWFFKYPDIIGAPITLTTENPPAPVLAKTTGKIQNLLVSDNQIVSKEQVLGVIENPAKLEDIQALYLKLKKFEREFSAGSSYQLKNEMYELGDVQSYYSNFYKRLDEYNQFIKLNYYQKKIRLYKIELEKYSQYINNLNIQNKILAEELFLTRKQFNRDSLLFDQELMSESDLEKSKTALLAKSYNYEQNNLAITNTAIQIENINQNILELELQNEKQLSDQIIMMWEGYENLLSAIESWKHNFVLISPTDGIVTFNQFWDENQTVKVGETVITIIPQDEGEIIGKVKLSFDGAGKVQVGQQANIQFANYPYMEFGMVQGVVRSISLAPNNNSYTAEIELPVGLKTFYGVNLEFKQEMQGTIEIITEDIRLLERIVRPLRYILKKNTKFGEQKK